MGEPRDPQSGLMWWALAMGAGVVSLAILALVTMALAGLVPGAGAAVGVSTLSLLALVIGSMVVETKL